MKKTITLLFFAALFIVFTSGTNNSGGRAGQTGSPGESSCNQSGCHSSFALNTAGGSVTLASDMVGWAYVPGVTYNMTLKVARPGSRLFGLSLEALTTANANAGTLTITNAAQTAIGTRTISGVSRRSVTHVSGGGASNDSMKFAFRWVAPATNIGNVTVYFSGLCANADGGTNGDYAYTGTRVLTPFVSTFNRSLNVIEFSVFPNPVREKIHVRYTATANITQFRLLSLDGKVIADWQETGEGVNKETDLALINNQLGGAYLLQIINGEHTGVQRLMINR